MKVKDTEYGWQIKCPGCGNRHYFPKDGRWTYNNNPDNPTFHPSMVETVNPKDSKDYRPDVITSVCHFILIDGVATFCSDSTHSNAGKVLPLKDFEKHEI